MRYEDYVKKNMKVLEPISEVTIKIVALAQIQLLANEYRGEFGNKVSDICDKERDNLNNFEIGSGLLEGENEN